MGLGLRVPTGTVKRIKNISNESKSIEAEIHDKICCIETLLFDGGQVMVGLINLWRKNFSKLRVTSVFELNDWSPI